MRILNKLKSVVPPRFYDETVTISGAATTNNSYEPVLHMVKERFSEQSEERQGMISHDLLELVELINNPSHRNSTTARGHFLRLVVNNDQPLSNFQLVAG